MMATIKKWLGCSTPNGEERRHRRSAHLDEVIQAERRQLRKERVITKLEARSSARYYNALTDAMTMLRD